MALVKKGRDSDKVSSRSSRIEKTDSNKKSSSESGNKRCDSVNQSSGEKNFDSAVPTDQIIQTKETSANTSLSTENEKEKVGKNSKDNSNKDDLSKTDLRELRKLREKCQSLSERNELLEKRFQEKEDDVNDDIGKYESLNQKYQELVQSYALLESQVKEIKELQDQCVCKENIHNEVFDDDSVESQMEEKVNKMKDEALKNSLLKLMKKHTITEKAYRYVQQQWDNAKKKINTNEERKEELKQSETDVISQEVIEKPLINGNALLKASLGKTDSVLNKISRKVTRDEMKSFVSKLSGKNTDGVMSIASAMLQENRSFLNVIEPKMKSALEQSIKEEELLKNREVKSQKESSYPQFPTRNRLHAQSLAKRHYSLENEGMGNHSNESRHDDSVRAKRSRGGGRGAGRRGQPWELRGRGLVRGPYRGRVFQKRGSSNIPAPSFHEDNQGTTKTFTFSNKIRSDILEIPGYF